MVAIARRGRGKTVKGNLLWVVRVVGEGKWRETSNPEILMEPVGGGAKSTVHHCFKIGATIPQFLLYETNTKGNTLVALTHDRLISAQTHPCVSLSSFHLSLSLIGSSSNTTATDDPVLRQPRRFGSPD